MSDDRPTEIVRDTFSYGYWLKNGRTNQATTDSLEAFDRWYESEKRKWKAFAFKQGLRAAFHESVESRETWTPGDIVNPYEVDA